ncbi:hypothetical protein M3J09_011765 [Ascochyta lentis]
MSLVEHFSPSCRTSSCDCTRHSVIPAAPPKFPSIWKGGWLSNRFGKVLFFSSASMCL